MPANVVKSYAKDKGISVEKAEERWEKAKEQAKKEGHKEGSVDFYKYTMGIFKRMMGED